MNDSVSFVQLIKGKQRLGQLTIESIFTLHGLAFVLSHQTREKKIG